MYECQCNICKIVKCLRCPNNAEPILEKGAPATRKSAKEIVFTDDCLCNTCIVVECIRHPKKAEPILKEEPISEEPAKVEPVKERVIIIREPCPPRHIKPCPDRDIPWIDPSRVTAYASNHPPRVGVYAVPAPMRTHDPFRTIVYGLPREDSGYTSTNTTIVHSLYGVTSPVRNNRICDSSSNSISSTSDVSSTFEVGPNRKRGRPKK